MATEILQESAADNNDPTPPDQEFDHIGWAVAVMSSDSPPTNTELLAAIGIVRLLLTQPGSP
jgi:hypothetical protein